MTDTFGTQLRALRRRHGTSQRELAKLLDCTAAAISQWESGDTQPTMDKITSIAKHYQISLEWLLNGAELASMAEANLLAARIRALESTVVDLHERLAARVRALESTIVVLHERLDKIENTAMPAAGAVAA
jgi:transcriptional regulator with XRE-family HTH domain